MPTIIDKIIESIERSTQNLDKGVQQAVIGLSNLFVRGSYLLEIGLKHFLDGLAWFFRHLWVWCRSLSQIIVIIFWAIALVVLGLEISNVFLTWTGSGLLLVFLVAIFWHMRPTSKPPPPSEDAVSKRWAIILFFSVVDVVLLGICVSRALDEQPPKNLILKSLRLFLTFEWDTFVETRVLSNGQVLLDLIDKHPKTVIISLGFLVALTFLMWVLRRPDRSEPLPDIDASNIQPDGGCEQEKGKLGEEDKKVKGTPSWKEAVLLTLLVFSSTFLFGFLGVGIGVFFFSEIDFMICAMIGAMIGAFGGVVVIWFLIRRTYHN